MKAKKPQMLGRFVPLPRTESEAMSVCFIIYHIISHHISYHITLHYITLHYITLHYITLHYITLHYITLHYITLHYITLHYIILYYIFHILSYLIFYVKCIAGKHNQNAKRSTEWNMVCFLRTSIKSSSNLNSLSL